jgi:hypothetical protein
MECDDMDFNEVLAMRVSSGDYCQLHAEHLCVTYLI